MLRSFEGKSVFITGASSGIGRALAFEFAQQGARVALAARREDRLMEGVQEIEARGGTALAVVCDVTDRSSLDVAVARTVGAYGGIDVAVANAGFGVSGVFERLSAADFRRQFDTNVFGVIDTIYAVLPHLKRSKGRLGIVASILGRVGAPTSTAYCASKFALCGLAESLYYELAEHGVSVTCINPGIVASDIRRVDNRGVLHPNRPDPAAQLLCVPADRAARSIVRAIYKRRFEAIITGHGKAVVWVNRHFPRTFRSLIRLTTKTKLDRLQRAKRGG